MTTEIVFETHSTSVDNEEGVASGWAHSRLSETGRIQAREMGERRRDDGISVVVSSDLRRAAETVELAFAGSEIEVLLDWRLRECDYGQMTRMAVEQLHRTRADHIDTPYPGGESWTQAMTRVSAALEEVATRWEGRRILVVGHIATRWALDHVVDGVALETLMHEQFEWQKGWEYALEA